MVGAPAGDVELALLPVTGEVDKTPLGPLDVGKSDGPADAELLEGAAAVYVGEPFGGAEDGSPSGLP